LVRAVLLVVLVFVVIGFIVPMVSIQLRLSRNGKIARQLAESLTASFPGIRFYGAASYEKEVIYICVVNRLDEADRQEVERWVREQKAEQNIAPEIWIRFENEDLDKEIVVRISALVGPARRCKKRESS
jgi:hypothetical protein